MATELVDLGPIPEEKLVAIIREIAMGVHSIVEIAKIHQVNLRLLKHYLSLPEVDARLRQARTDWQSAGNAKERIRLKAMFALEQSIEDAYGLIKDKSQSGAARVEAVKTLAKLADVGPVTDAGNGPGGGIKITINIGDSAKNVTLDAKPVDLTKDAYLVEDQ